ncbi:hypothetical protein OG373_13820 [Streptomyces avidinii]|uniref:hypothetical protein n=1 Tax=Streptomyces avidinii TaxID=1895 RepID=UPI003867652B|nr:hypothetical protein OG373_13820 [Streptomyces avidinii]
MNIAQWAPVAVVTGALIAGSVSGYTTRRTVRAAAHSAHVTRQLDALDAFLTAVDAIGEVTVDDKGGKKDWLEIESQAVRAAVRRLLLVVPPRLKERCTELAETAYSVAQNGIPTTMSARALNDLRGQASAAYFQKTLAALPEARQARAQAALTALIAVEKLHTAQDERARDADHSALIAEAREALRASGITKPSDQVHLLDHGRRSAEHLIQERFRIRQSKLERQRMELIADVNAWINGTKRRPQARSGA